MRAILFLLFPLILVQPSAVFAHKDFKYWENFTPAEKKNLLSHKDVYKDAIAFYNGEFKASDDDRTFRLLDTLTQSDRYLTFYFYLFNQIVTTSDGALSEVMGQYCIRITNRYPAYVFQYLARRYLDGDTSFLLDYADYIGYEFGLSENSKQSLDSFKAEIDTARREHNGIMPDAFLKEQSIFFDAIETAIAAVKE